VVADLHLVVHAAEHRVPGHGHAARVTLKGAHKGDLARGVEAVDLRLLAVPDQHVLLAHIQAQDLGDVAKLARIPGSSTGTRQ
jgi:hypothetical protein